MKNRKMNGLYSSKQEHDSCGIGIVANIKGCKSHEIIEQGLTVLLSLEHRGACGFEENTGDGAGILLQIPHIFLAEACSDAGFSLPDDIGSYGVGMVFLPPDPKYTEICRQRLEDIVNEESQTVLGWRTVPVDASGLGNTAKECMP